MTKTPKLTSNKYYFYIIFIVLFFLRIVHVVTTKYKYKDYLRRISATSGSSSSIPSSTVSIWSTWYSAISE